MKRILCLALFCVAPLVATMVDARSAHAQRSRGGYFVSGGVCRACGAACGGVYPVCPNCGRQGTICPTPVPSAQPQPSPAPQAAPGAAPTAPTAPGEAPAAPETAAPSAAPSPSALAGNFGAVSGPGATSPNMIGDFFGGGYFFTGFGNAQPRVAIAGADRNFKIVEGNSPIPRDRLFGSYNHFQDALPGADGRIHNLDRYMVGLEKTFFDDLMSVELRAPIVNGLDSFQVEDVRSINSKETEFGNLALAVKSVLWRGQRSTLAAGLGMVFPTGSDSTLDLSYVGQDGDFAFVANDAFHLQPFLGYQWRPTDRFFTLFFTQADFDTNGNHVAIQFDDDPARGRLQDPALLFLDWSAGYYVYLCPQARILRGVAPLVELHYSTTMQDFDQFLPFGPGGAGITSDRVDSGTPDRRRDTLNLTGGLQFDLFRRTQLIAAGVAPLRSGGQTGYADRDFSAEFVLMLQHAY